MNFAFTGLYSRIFKEATFEKDSVLLTRAGLALGGLRSERGPLPAPLGLVIFQGSLPHADLQVR